MGSTPAIRNVHRFAVFTACCTFFLLIAGALVTSNDAGLAVPDWPLSYGSLTPPMVGGIFYEHGHRVIAACVGMLSIVLAVWLWRVEQRSWVRWLGVAAVGAVVAQGILGGLTVLFFLPPAVSSAHAALAQLFFCTILSIALFTGSWWQRSHPVASDFGSPRIHSLAAATAAAVLVQLILGAAFRHKGFGIIPHLVWAAVVTVLIFSLARLLRRRFGSIPTLRNASRLLHAVIGIQLLLGAAAWWSRVYAADFPQPIPVMITFTVIHTVIGALVLASTVLLTLICHRILLRGEYAKPPMERAGLHEAWAHMSTTPAVAARPLSRSMGYVSLTKPDVSFLVVITTLAGYALGSIGPLDWMRMAHTVLATTLVAAGTSALNHYLERDSDGRMRRTAARPLPTGVLAPAEALWFGAALVAVGVIDLLITTNALAALLAVATSVMYLGVYTPLKTRTTWCTAIGAIPGALPPLIGWAAARGSLDVGGWVLFGILFLWQFPHFHAIAWMYREDYGRAGIKMLPVEDPDGRATFSQILVTAAVLVPFSLLGAVVGLAGPAYFFGALVLGLMLVEVCVWAAASKTNARAKWLMHATVIHLPLLLGLMILDRFWWTP